MVTESVVITGALLSGSGISAAMLAAVFLCGVPETMADTGPLRKSGMATRRVMSAWLAMTFLCAASVALFTVLLRAAPPEVVAFAPGMSGACVARCTNRPFDSSGGLVPGESLSQAAVGPTRTTRCGGSAAPNRRECTDGRGVRHGLRSLLEQAGLDVVGQCGSAREASRRIVEQSTQVAVLNVHLPDGTGIEVCRDARAADAGLKCLMLTSYADDEALCSVVLAGAAGYVLRQLHSHHIADAILRASADEPLIASKELARVKVDLLKTSRNPDFDDVTDEEKDILALIAEDRDNRQISEALALDEATVRDLVSAMLSKLGFSPQLQAWPRQPETRRNRRRPDGRPRQGASSPCRASSAPASGGFTPRLGS